MKRRVYLDFAAATPVCNEARNAYMRTLRRFGNPSSPHEEGRAAHDVLEEARSAIARELEVRPTSIVFTGSATEANALVILGYVRSLMRAGRSAADIHILYLPSSHASIVENVLILKREGVSTEEIPFQEGDIDYSACKALLRPTTALVLLDAICAETGIRFDTRRVKSILQEVKSLALLHVDASQLPLVEEVQRMRLGADFMTLDAGKVGGIRGIGVLVHPSYPPLVPLFGGGGQEGGLRSGTESPALASAFAAALCAAAKHRARFSALAVRMRARLVTNVRAALPSIIVNEGKRQTPHIVNISLSGLDTDYVVTLLDRAGFSVSTKSACESEVSGSRAVLALFGDESRSRATLRISFGASTTLRTVDSFVRALITAVRFLEANAVHYPE
jgi:cysteine desulfurase